MSTIQVRVAVPTCACCPVANLSAETVVREIRVHPDQERIDFVAEDAPTDPPAELELFEFAEEAHGRYDLSRVDADGSHEGSAAVDGAVGRASADRLACGCDCFPSAFGDLPMSPRETRVEDGELLASFVLSDYGELQAICDAFEETDIRHVLVDRDETDDRSNIAPVDLSEVTERQAAVAAVAVERGYFEPDGASAAEVADDLDLAKSTVSEHVRRVTATVFSQLFDPDRS